MSSGMFAIEIEFLTAVSVAATPYNRDEAEWPPHPDRLFQALVAAWGRQDPPCAAERAALMWLEAQESPEVSAPAAYRRDVVTHYVPPNDAETSKGKTIGKDLKGSLQVIPELRGNRQGRSFPAAIPADDPPRILYAWPAAEGADEHRGALAKLAAEVTYLGHSHSLVRASVTDLASDTALDPGWMGGHSQALRVPYPGRLSHLQQHYEDKTRPRPSLATHRYEPDQTATPPHSLFAPDDMLVLNDDGGFAPALAAFPLVAKRLRDALLDCAPTDRPVPALISGHAPDGSPTKHPHLAIMPLADVGWLHSSGRLMGVGLVWPRDIDDQDRQATLSAIAAFLRNGHGQLNFGRAGVWRLRLDTEAERASLRPTRYFGPACRWGTVLPVVLDRHPKDRPGEDLANVIAKACLNIGLPPEVVDEIDVEFHKHAPIKAAPGARDVHNTLAADSPYRTRPLAHLVVTFAQPVLGPLLLGAGRFRGLGLCLPMEDGAPP